jgi:hypothetical protein
VKNVKLISESDLPYVSEREISRSISGLRDSLFNLNPNWRTSKNERLRTQCLHIETEICYLQRELMWRKKREACHKTYLQARSAMR